MGEIYKVGSKGPVVVRIQVVVGVRADGIFGPVTETAVKGYQRRKGLLADGIVGPLTLTQMFPAAPPVDPNPTTTETPWLDQMHKWIGEQEITGKPMDDFEKMVFSHTTLHETHIEPAACAATLCAALELNGFKSPHSAKAVSFLDYGVPCGPKRGAITVFEWSPGDHHVSIYDDAPGSSGQTRALFTGGNQSHKVGTDSYPLKAVMGYRWPVK